VSECDREASTMRRLWPTRGCCVMEINNCINYYCSKTLIIFGTFDGVTEILWDDSGEIFVYGTNHLLLLR